MNTRHPVIDAVRSAARGTMDRRGFLRLTGILGGGFVLASALPSALAADNPAAEIKPLVHLNELNAFIRVGNDGKIQIYSANAEMGQGIKTTLPMIIAEEMGANWADVEVLQSPVNELLFGQQMAGGSTTVPRTWDQMRQMGAAAREMFISAGALVMEVPREELKTANSRVTHTSGDFRTFAQLASLAAKQELPKLDSLEFKERADYTIIGKPITGVDNRALVTGQALFGIDVRVPGMVYAAYQKCPAIGGKVVSANTAEIKRLPGVIDCFIVKGNQNVMELLDGVAIVGTSTHAVFTAKQKLVVNWDESSASKDSWSKMVADATALHGKRGGEPVVKKGDVDAEFNNADNTTLSAFYEYPYVSHLTLEPMNTTAHYKAGTGGQKDSVELWVPNQGPGRVFGPMKTMFGLEQDQVAIHQMRLGGSFGRRIFTEYICEATEISKKTGKPVKLTWTREDDIRHDFFRVGGFQSVKGAIDKTGKLVAFENHHIGAQQNGQPAIGSGFTANEFPLETIGNALVTNTLFEVRTPCGPWRAPRSNTNAFVVQSFLDELAHAGKRDFRDFLLEILGPAKWIEDGNIRSLHTGRAAGVIRLACEKAGWGRQMPTGSGLGLAFFFSHAGHIAEVAEVEVDANKRLTVKRVTVAVDVGPIINPSGAVSQVQGAVIDGLSTMMTQKITMEGGRIQQSNLSDYPVLRMPSAPAVIDVHFIESDYRPTGLGEPALPPLAPAVANAIFAATGHRVRKMPLSEEGYSI
jgi:isoquinoline 1-oxidoreductase beta subunit